VYAAYYDTGLMFIDGPLLSLKHSKPNLQARNKAYISKVRRQ
jgi:hypothetical protein